MGETAACRPGIKVLAFFNSPLWRFGLTWLFGAVRKAGFVDRVDAVQVGVRPQRIERGTIPVFCGTIAICEAYGRVQTNKTNTYDYFV